MSSQSKRRAESEEVAHKKKPRQGGLGGDEDEFNQVKNDGLEDDDEDNIIRTDKRTRGKRVDYTEALANDNGPKSGEEIPKETKGAPSGPRTVSPQREPVNIEEEDEDEEEEEYDGDDGSDEDEVTDDYEEDEDE